MDDDELARLQRELIQTLIEIDHATAKATELAERIAAEQERRNAAQRNGGTVHPLFPEDPGDE